MHSNVSGFFQSRRSRLRTLQGRIPSAEGGRSEGKKNVAALKISVIAGNPKANSRTLHAAEGLARFVATGLKAGNGTASDIQIIDLALHTGELFDWSSTTIAGLADRVRGSDVIVVASPTYKATYTGLLKLFMERFGSGELAGTVAVPMMLAAAPAHLMAADVHLRPLLVELGASTPTPAVSLLDTQTEDLEAALADWLGHSLPLLSAFTSAAG